MRPSLFAVFRLWPVLLAALLASTPGRGQVSDRTDRAALITSAQALIEEFSPETKPPLERYAELRYPFEFVVEEAPAPVVQVTAAAPDAPAPAPAREATAAEVLEAFSGRLTVSGVIRLGGEYRLITPDGPLLRGQRIRFPFQNRSYVIEVESISDDTYNLRLDEAVREIKIDPNAGRGLRRASGTQTVPSPSSN